MVFENEDQLREFISVSSGLKLGALAPLYNQVVERYFIPIMGKTFWESFLGKYDAGNGSLKAEEKELLHAIRSAFAPCLLYHYVPIGNISITPGGFRVSESSNTKPASQFRIKEFEHSVLNQAYFGLDRLLLFLDSNQGDFTEWKQGDAYKEINSRFITSANDFNRWFNIGENRFVYTKLLPIMTRIEETQICELLGEELFEELKASQIGTNGFSDEQKALIKKLKPAIVHLTMASAIPELSITIDSRGVTLFSNSFQVINQQKPVSTLDRSDLVISCLNNGELYLTKARKYLEQHLSDFPKYNSLGEDLKGDEFGLGGVFF